MHCDERYFGRKRVRARERVAVVPDSSEFAYLADRSGRARPDCRPTGCPPRSHSVTRLLPTPLPSFLLLSLVGCFARCFGVRSSEEKHAPSLSSTEQLARRRMKRRGEEIEKDHQETAAVQPPPKRDKGRMNHERERERRKEREDRLRGKEGRKEDKKRKNERARALALTDTHSGGGNGGSGTTRDGNKEKKKQKQRERRGEQERGGKRRERESFRRLCPKAASASSRQSGRQGEGGREGGGRATLPSEAAGR